MTDAPLLVSSHGSRLHTLDVAVFPKQALLTIARCASVCLMALAKKTLRV